MAGAVFARADAPFDAVLGFVIIPFCAPRACHRAASLSRAFARLFHEQSLWRAHATACCCVAGRALTPGARRALRDGANARAVALCRAALRRRLLVTNAAFCADAMRRCAPSPPPDGDVDAQLRATRFLLVNETNANVWVHWIDGSGAPLARDGDCVPPVRANQRLGSFGGDPYAAPDREFSSFHLTNGHFYQRSEVSHAFVVCARENGPPLLVYQQRRAFCPIVVIPTGESRVITHVHGVRLRDGGADSGSGAAGNPNREGVNGGSAPWEVDELLVTTRERQATPTEDTYTVLALDLDTEAGGGTAMIADRLAAGIAGLDAPCAAVHAQHSSRLGAHRCVRSSYLAQPCGRLTATYTYTLIAGEILYEQEWAREDAADTRRHLRAD